MADRKSAFAPADETAQRQSASGGGTVGRLNDTPEYPEGTHPLAPLSEQTLSAQNLVYRELSDDEKPDPTTVAQAQVRPEEQ